MEPSGFKSVLGGHSYGNYREVTSFVEHDKTMNLMRLDSLLEHICGIASPSGYENGITSYLGELMGKMGFEARLDVIGNLVCYRKGSDSFRVMIVAHCDEVGLVVKYISDDGYLYFSGLGKIDISLLYGRHVLISHSGKSVPGVIGARPAHFGSIDVTNKEMSSLWIDIGAKSKQEAQTKVSVGDSITFKADMSRLGDHLVSCKALDNRSGIAALVEACYIIRDLQLPFDLYVVFSVQEEVVLIGSAPAFYAIHPDIGVAIDVTHATDIPDIDNRKYGDIRLDKGPVIPIGSNLSPIVQNKIKDLAANIGIEFQEEALPGFSGTDIAQAQITGTGCHTGLISIPCRYMHSTVETVSIADVKGVSQLIVSLLKGFDTPFKERLRMKRIP